MNVVINALWQLRAIKELMCVATPHSLGGYELQVLRGPESEVMWTHIVASERELARASRAIRERLEQNGWVLVDDAGERHLTRRVQGRSISSAA